MLNGGNVRLHPSGLPWQQRQRGRWALSCLKKQPISKTAKNRLFQEESFGMAE